MLRLYHKSAACVLALGSLRRCADGVRITPSRRPSSPKWSGAAAEMCPQHLGPIALLRLQWTTLLGPRKPAANSGSDQRSLHLLSWFHALQAQRLQPALDCVLVGAEGSWLTA